MGIINENVIVIDLTINCYLLIFSTNSSNKYEESCGPGLASG
jgi:hypothetical protein